MHKIAILAVALGFMTNDQVWGDCQLSGWKSTPLKNGEISQTGTTLCYNDSPIACSTTLINESNTKANGSEYKCTSAGKWEILTAIENTEDAIKTNSNQTTTTLVCKDNLNKTYVCFKTTEQGKTKPLHEKITCESARHYKCDFHSGIWSAATK